MHAGMIVHQGAPQPTFETMLKYIGARNPHGGRAKAILERGGNAPG
jgi:hypothetical protein